MYICVLIVPSLRQAVMRTSSLKFINRQTVNMASETIWSFGYGSNMDVVALEAKKKVKVLGKLLQLSA